MKEPDRIPIIIDTDPGIDDALALLLAFKSKKLDVKLITTVAGNISVETATKNALFLVEKYAKEPIPVVKGSSRALCKESVRAEDVHGVGGLGNFNIDKPEASESGAYAEDAIYAVLKSSLTPVTIVALGSLTNIAKLLMAHPDCVNYIKKLYIMAGSFNGSGNIVDWAEFNAYVDPEALDIVLKSSLDIVLSPLELGIDTSTPKQYFAEREAWLEKDEMIAKMIEGGFDSVLKGRFGVHDPNTILALTRPMLYSFKKCDVKFYTQKGKDGQMFIKLNPKGKYTVQLTQNSDLVRKMFLQELYSI